jgi:hypothetical protein
LGLIVSGPHITKTLSDQLHPLLYSSVYWSCLFILHKAVIEEITSLLKSFLWNGSDLSYSNAKIALDTICLPKKGGLGVKNLEVWNRAAMVKHLWSICNPTKAIWSSWISSYLLCGRSIWEIPCPETILGAGERFLVFVVLFENLSTFVLEMGILFHYGLIIGIRWAPWWSSLGIGLLLILA